MVEERSLSDAELDAALSEAFAIDPSAEFVARVRRRVADEPNTDRRVRLFAVAAAIAAVGIVLPVVMLQRKPIVAQSPRIITAKEPARAVPQETTVVRDPIPGRPAVASLPSNRGRDKFQRLPPTDVLVPAAEQKALQRLLERPPTEVLRFSPAAVDEPVVVTAIVIPPVSIDPLTPSAQEGGLQ